MQAPDWKARCETIGLKQVRLAELAGVSKFTVLRFLAGSADLYAANEKAIIAAIEAEERRVLRLLLALHGNESRVPSSGLHEAPVLNGHAA